MSNGMKTPTTEQQKKTDCFFDDIHIAMCIATKEVKETFDVEEVNSLCNTGYWIILTTVKFEEKFKFVLGKI